VRRVRHGSNLTKKLRKDKEKNLEIIATEKIKRFFLEWIKNFNKDNWVEIEHKFEEFLSNLELDSTEKRSIRNYFKEQIF